MNRLFSRELPDFARALQWSPDGARLAAATLAGAIVTLDARTGEPAWSAAGHPGGALSLAFAPDGTRIATGGHDGKVRIFDAATGAELRVLEVAERAPPPVEREAGWVGALCWPDARPDVFAAAFGHTVRFFSPSGDPIGPTYELPSTVSTLFYHPTLQAFGVGHYGGVSLLAPPEPRPMQRLAYRGSILVASASPDGRFVASGNQDATVRFWDLEQKDEATLTGYPEKVRVLAWAPNSMALATGGGTKIVVWMCTSGAPVGTAPATLERHERRVTGVAFSARGESILSCGEDGRFCRWASDGGGPVHVRAEDRVEVPLLAMAQDAPRERVACAGAGGLVVAWSVAPPGSSPR